jgi:hypothetical protein
MPSRAEQREFAERLKRGHRDRKEHSITMAVQPEQAVQFNEMYRRHGITGAEHDVRTGLLHADSGAMNAVEKLRNYHNRDGNR